MLIREAGDSALVAELGASIDVAVNARAIGVAEAIRQRRIPGIRDVMPTFHSVAVFFDPLATDVEIVRSALREAGDAEPRAGAGKTVEVPVAYGGEAGPDLDAVAAFAGCTPRDVIARHASPTYRVFMLGFLPGFAYMARVNETIAVPRLSTPRLRVAAGSVGIAGQQTGIYPRESPGGWHIIGRTSLTMFDADRTPPALVAPGDSVRFVPVAMTAIEATDATDVVSGFRRTRVGLTAATPGAAGTRFVTVLRPGLLTTIQDTGRWGYQGVGVPVSGPLDPVAHHLANAVVGNSRDAATLEATVVGPELKFEQPTRVAVTGADLHATLDAAEVPMDVAVECRAGSVLRFGARRAGARAYIAFDGGITVPAVLGSRATHVLSGLGGIDGRAIRAGDCLPLGHAGLGVTPRQAPKGPPYGPSPGAGGARLRVLPGPQAECFAPSAQQVLHSTRYTISPQSDRMGYRLAGGRPLPQPPTGDMISDATFVGAVQVPPSGQPILLMADRQTTGGYPQIAVVITADLPLAAQLAPGDWVEFDMCSRSDAIAALAAQEREFGAFR